jgi:hypothetical protein
MPLRQGSRFGSGVTPPGAHTSQGTPGGKRATGIRPGRYPLKIGDEVYLWILIALEVGAIAALRHAFRRRHGG